MVPDLKYDVKNKTAPLAIVATPGAGELAASIDSWLISWFKKDLGDRKSFIIESDCPRFTSGEGKGIIYETVRGKDLYII